MLAQLARTLTEWHCNSFTDLIDNMELWDWNVANKDFWSRLAKLLHSPKVSVTLTEKMDKILASVCCFVSLNQYRGIVTVPGSFLKSGDLR